jgi:hypothetical protein
MRGQFFACRTGMLSDPLGWDFLEFYTSLQCRLVRFDHILGVASIWRGAGYRLCMHYPGLRRHLDLHELSGHGEHSLFQWIDLVPGEQRAEKLGPGGNGNSWKVLR